MDILASTELPAQGFDDRVWSLHEGESMPTGGLRVIYYYLVRDVQIWLLSLCDKDEALDAGIERRDAAMKGQKTVDRAEKSEKRNLFTELMSGVEAMRRHREGEITLRTRGHSARRGVSRLASWQVRPLVR